MLLSVQIHPLCLDMPRQRSVPHANQLATKCGLSSGAVDSLWNAHLSRHYRVKILTRYANSRRTTAVLLGESHYKSRKAAELGQEVLCHFDDYGYEGVDVSKTVGGRVQKVWFAAFDAVAKLLRFRGSSIHDALVRATDKEDSVRAYWLEKGHEPNVLEHLFSVGPLYFAWMLGRALFDKEATVPSAASDTSADACASAFKVIGVGIVGGISLTALLLKLLSYEHVAEAFDKVCWRLPDFGRDRTMARNTGSIFECLAAKQPSVSVLLDLFGAAHIGGVKRHLIEMGFEELPLEDLVPRSDVAPAVESEWFF